jgi:hypothetical protein
MGHLKGAGEMGAVRLGFDRRVRLEFHGSKISSDGGLLLFRELDEVLGLHDIAGGLLRDTRTGRNRLHTLVSLLRQSVFGRLAGYEDVNDADRLALDPVMRQVVADEPLRPRWRRRARWAGSRPRCWPRPTIALLWLKCQGIGSTGFIPQRHPNGSRWTWTVQSARPMARKRARPGTAISAACAITRCLCSTSSAIWNAALCARAMSTAPTDGKRF